MVVVFLAMMTANTASYACEPVSPGSALLDCRTPQQVEQARLDEAKALEDQKRAIEAKAVADHERAAEAAKRKDRLTPQIAKKPSTDPADLIGCRVTLAKFYELRDGMSYYQVREILGCNGTLLSRSDVPGYTTVMMGWDGEGWGANMNAMFQNNSLVSKAQLGLK